MRCRNGKACAPADRAGEQPRLHVEAEEADPVAHLQRDERHQQRGVDRPVDPRARPAAARTSAGRYRWRRSPGGCARCGIPWPAACRGGPTASSRSCAGPCRRQLAQGVELGALAGLELGLQAEGGVAGEEPDRLVLHRRDIGRDGDHPLGRLGDLLPDQPERAAPARPDPLDLALAAPRGRQLEYAPRPRRRARGPRCGRRRRLRRALTCAAASASAGARRSKVIFRLIGAEPAVGSEPGAVQRQRRPGRAARPAPRRPGRARRSAPPRPRRRPSSRAGSGRSRAPAAPPIGHDRHRAGGGIDHPGRSIGGALIAALPPARSGPG